MTEGLELEQQTLDRMAELGYSPENRLDKMKANRDLVKRPIIPETKIDLERTKLFLDPLFEFVEVIFPEEMTQEGYGYGHEPGWAGIEAAEACEEEFLGE